jgi:hypothetical protein
VFVEGNIGGQTGHALVDIVKGLQVGQLNHDKEGLFKGVFYGGGFL